jgi:cation diffusion facilitator family transporter
MPTMSPLMKIATGSIVVGIVVLALKTLAWWMTGSIALLSDALESTVNVATAIAALIAIRLASRPADANHPYGHHKAELFSAILEGVMIIIAALLIMREAYHAPLEGLLVNGLASVINAFWCWMLITQGRKRRSPALVADGRHLFTDVISSVGVTFGVLVAILSGWAMLDPLMALIVAINILWSGWRVMRESLSGLLDEAIPDVTLAQVRETISREAEGAVEAHDLRTRHAGQASFVEFHLIVPGDMTVNAAHDICDRIEAALKEILEGCVVTIHVEPERKAKHSGVVVL